MNKLPFPRYYDGLNWNTTLLPTRKSIPKYLHQDLPSLKHMYIKQKFKEMGKFNCPNLQYFNSLIKNVKSKKNKHKIKLIDGTPTKTYTQIKEQMQYALLTTDRQSNVIEELINSASQTIIKRNKRSKSIAPSKQRYFDNTLQLVFKHRKAEYANSLKKQGQSPTASKFDKELAGIQLLPYNS